MRKPEFLRRMPRDRNHILCEERVESNEVDLEIVPNVYIKIIKPVLREFWVRHINRYYAIYLLKIHIVFIMIKRKHYSSDLDCPVYKHNEWEGQINTFKWVVWVTIENLIQCRYKLFFVIFESALCHGLLCALWGFEYFGWWLLNWQWRSRVLKCLVKLAISVVSVHPNKR